MLNWNAKKVQNLTGIEIWLFILGRVLVAFAVGILVTRFFPQLATTIALPASVIGVVLLSFAARGLW
jgi:Ca2+/Na+ antiporter